MSREVFDFFKSERDICVKTIIPNQNTIFMLTPALTNRFFYFWFIDGGERGSLSRRRERDHRRGKIDENDFKFKEVLHGRKTIASYLFMIFKVQRCFDGTSVMITVLFLRRTRDREKAEESLNQKKTREEEKN